MLELKNINASYGAIQALRDVSIRIDRGEIPGVSTKESRELVRARRRIRELESEVEILRRANELLGKDLRPKGSTR